MTSPLLAKAKRDGREIVNVTPERAGWTHVGFRALLGERDEQAVRQLVVVAPDRVAGIHALVLAACDHPLYAVRV